MQHQESVSPLSQLTSRHSPYLISLPSSLLGMEILVVFIPTNSFRSAPLLYRVLYSLALSYPILSYSILYCAILSYTIPTSNQLVLTLTLTPGSLFYPLLFHLYTPYSIHPTYLPHIILLSFFSSGDSRFWILDS
jgi:hypothetical protein